MSEAQSWNEKVIDEFRANGGKVGGMFEGMPLVLLHTTGAKTGQERIAPLVCRQEGERVYVFASKGGAPTNPDWFRNIEDNPIVSIEIGTEKREVRATVLPRAERDDIYAKHAAQYEGFANYQKGTDRIIPVIALDPR